MYGNFRYLTAIILLCVFQLKTVVSLQYGFDKKKDSVSLIETDENEDEKTEKESHKHKAELFTDSNVTGLFAPTADTANLTTPTGGLKLPVHFFAVPTPPPWA